MIIFSISSSAIKYPLLLLLEVFLLLLAVFDFVSFFDIRSFGLLYMTIPRDWGVNPDGMTNYIQIHRNIYISVRLIYDIRKLSNIKVSVKAENNII
jgi:hypothetical protein